MTLIILVFMIIIIGCIALMCWHKSLCSAPKEYNFKGETFHFSSLFRLIDGIDGWGKGCTIIKAELYDTEIIFYKSAIGDSDKVSLKYSQIKNVGIYTEKEIIEKSKSVIGRATVGGVLFGPLGAIIGGISGTGSTHNTKTHYYCTIVYTSSLGDEKMITLSNDCGGCDINGFNAKLKSFIKVPQYL